MRTWWRNHFRRHGITIGPGRFEPDRPRTVWCDVRVLLFLARLIAGDRPSRRADGKAR